MSLIRADEYFKMLRVISGKHDTNKKQLSFNEKVLKILIHEEYNEFLKHYLKTLNRE